MGPVPAGHDADENGDHDVDECYRCLLGQEAKGDCRCGVCCRRLLIEVRPGDADREPSIKERGSPIYGPVGTGQVGPPQLEGYVLNSAANEHACTFLNLGTNLCTIYDTRPLICRLFACDGAERDVLVQLGILPPRVAT
jgi:hypothetical protein